MTHETKKGLRKNVIIFKMCHASYCNNKKSRKMLQS